MKKIFLTFAVSLCFACFVNAQSDDFAELRNEILYLKDGRTLRKGDIVTFGEATGCYQNCFENIFYEPEEMLTKLTNKFTKNVYATLSGKKFTVGKIKHIKKDGDRIWLVVLRDNTQKENMYCYLKAALACGEIILDDNKISDNPIIIRQPDVTRPRVEEVAKPTIKAAEETKKNEVIDNKPIADEQKVTRDKPIEKNVEKEKSKEKKHKNAKKKSAENFSVADEIRKLKALMDEGIISKEEFEAQKAKLLK